MKKALILTALLGMSTLAAAQSTTTESTTQTGTSTTTQETTTTGTESTTQTGTETTTETTQTGTETTTTGTDATATAQTAMTPAEAFTRAQELAVQADVAYPQPFYDRTLWKAAVDNAYMASAGEAGNRDYAAYLAQLYTKTQWWINAYNAWVRLGTLTDQEKQWAALSAAKLAYIALQRGDKATARTYITQGMSWQNTQSLTDLMRRL